MKFKINDEVVIIAGKDKNKTGKVTKILRKQNKIVVEKINLRTKHVKKTAERAGEKIQYEAPFDASNAMLIDPKTKKRSRIGYKVSGKDKKQRVSKASKETLS